MLTSISFSIVFGCRFPDQRCARSSQELVFTVYIPHRFRQPERKLKLSLKVHCEWISHMRLMRLKCGGGPSVRSELAPCICRAGITEFSIISQFLPQRAIPPVSESHTRTAKPGL